MSKFPGLVASAHHSASLRRFSVGVEGSLESRGGGVDARRGVLRPDSVLPLPARAPIWRKVGLGLREGGRSSFVGPLSSLDFGGIFGRPAARVVFAKLHLVLLFSGYFPMPLIPLTMIAVTRCVRAMSRSVK